MPAKATMKRVSRDRRQGKAASTQAGEFVREEMDHIREGKHGARSSKQAIAIALSKARRAGVKLPAPARGTVSKGARRKASEDTSRAKKKAAPSRRRSRAATAALKREGHSAASKSALSHQTKSAARRRGPASRGAAAAKAARTRARRGRR